MSSPPASVQQPEEHSVDSGVDDDSKLTVDPGDESSRDGRNVGNDKSDDKSESGSRSTSEYTNIQELGQLHQLLGVIHSHIDGSNPEYNPDLERHREIGIPPGDFLRTRTELTDAVLALSRGIVAGLPDDGDEHETAEDATIQLTVNEFTDTTYGEGAT